jgi:hypothetical protein
MNTNTKTLTVLISSLIACNPRPDAPSTSSDSGNIPTTSGASTTSSESNCSLDPKSPQDCDKGLVCIGLNVTDLGTCVTPCLDSCLEGICQDWTATSKPQLPSGVGICK